MKKIIYILPLLFLFIACNSDDSSSKEIETKQTDWIPTKIDLGNAFTTIYSFDYPHVTGCDFDFLRILNANSAIFFEHEINTCEVIETQQNFQRTENQINFVLFDTEINGTVITETNSQMVIEADASQLSDVILTIYPEAEPYAELIKMLKIKISFNKK